MLITQDTKMVTRNLELGGGLASSDGGDCMTGIEEPEEQVSAKDGRTHRGRQRRRRGFGRVADSGGGVWGQTGRHSPVRPYHARVSHPLAEGTSKGSEQC